MLREVHSSAVPNREPSPQQSHLNRQVERRPCPICGQHFRRGATQCERQAASVSEGQRVSAFQGPKGACQLGILSEKWLEDDSGSGEQLAHSPHIKVDINELPHDLGKVGGAEPRAGQSLSYLVRSRLLVDESQDG